MMSFANFGNSSETEGEPSQKKKKTKMGVKKEEKSILPRPGIETGTCR